VEPGETAVARQRLSKDVPTETNTHTTMEELLDAEFSVQSILYQIIYSERKVGN
jgi:hypothetical protein